MESHKGLKKDEDMMEFHLEILLWFHIDNTLGKGKNACKELSQETIGDIQTINEDISQYNYDIRAE